jgi:hypothetical protein
VLVWGFGVALPTGGCSFGPKVLELSHGRYNEAVRRVYEEQLLRNLVHMRYNEPPLDLNVSSIAAQYELDGGVEARPLVLHDVDGLRAGQRGPDADPPVPVGRLPSPLLA